MKTGAEKVIITGRRQQVLEEACKELGQRSDYIVHDVTKTGTHEKVAASVAGRYGRIDILVNNAGINQKKETLEGSDKDFNEIIQTNLNGLFAMTRETGKFMAEKGRGSSINVTSMAALYGIPTVASYTASKSVVLGPNRATFSNLFTIGC